MTYIYLSHVPTVFPLILGVRQVAQYTTLAWGLTLVPGSAAQHIRWSNYIFMRWQLISWVYQLPWQHNNNSPVWILNSILDDCSNWNKKHGQSERKQNHHHINTTVTEHNLINFYWLLWHLDKLQLFAIFKPVVLVVIRTPALRSSPPIFPA